MNHLVKSDSSPDGATPGAGGSTLPPPEMVDAQVYRVTEESYRIIFDLASDAIFIHDVTTGEILDANRKASEMHGYTLDEFKAFGVAGISDGAPPYDIAHAAEKVRQAAAGLPQRFEWLARNRAGARFWVEVDLHRVPIMGVDRILASVRNIDERKRAEALLREANDELERRVRERTVELDARTHALEQAEQRFRAIAEASPVPLLISRPSDGRILFANERLESLIGVGPGELIDRFTPDFYYDPSDRPRVVELIRERGHVRDLEIRIRRMDGSARWMSTSIQRLVFDHEEAFATSFIDITERRQAVEALKASEESYRGLFDHLTELVYIQSLDGRFLNVNDAVCRAYGYASTDLIGKTPDFLAAPGMVDIEETKRLIALAARGEPQRFDWWGRRKDGSVFPKEVVAKRSRYFGEDVVIAVARDISDRVEANQRLQESEQHFRRMIENASDLITIMDADGTIRYLSPAIERILGYDPEELLGRPAFEYIAPEDLQSTIERWQLLIANPDTPVPAEFHFRHKNGSWRFMEGIGVSFVPGSLDGGLIINSRDITERKRAEARLRLQTSVLEAQGEASIDGILVVREDGDILSYNQRFVDLWQLPPDVVARGSDEAAINAVLDKVEDPEAFVKRVRELYNRPQDRSRDELRLKDGRYLDRYTAPIVGSEGEYHGRIWFFRDITREKQYATELERERREADNARERANHYARSLERELELGRKIQQGLFPASLPQPSGWESAVRFHPVWQVAGDFYDAFDLPTGRVALLVADVSGKGVGAALFMALFQSLLRASAERSSRTPEAQDETVLLEALTSTNNYVRRTHRHAHMFASAFFGLLDPRTGRLHFVNAGHEPPILIRAEGTGERLGVTGPAVGIVGDAEYGIGLVQMNRGDTLLAYTDGVTEARNGGREFFTEERLLDAIGAPFESASELVDRIDQAVQSFTGNAPPADDITILATRRV
jgi:PAS domain S-box-containing protein